MKDMDPDIMIMGPELEFANKVYLDDLCDAPSANSSITGTISSSGAGNGKPYIDYLTYHSYGGFGDAFTSTVSPYNSASRRQRYVEGGHNLYDSYVKTYTTYAKPYDGVRPAPLKLAIDEFNMHNNDGSGFTATLTTTTSASSTLSAQITGDDYNGNTFLAGQFVVDQMAAMMGVDDGSGNCPYEFCNIWSIRETANFGLLNNDANNSRKPTFWHFWLMSNYFKGTFYKNNKIYPALGAVDRCYKAYACRGDDYIAVLLMNQTENNGNSDPNTHSAGAHTFTLDFNNGGPDIQFDLSLPGVSHTVSLNQRSTALVFFSCNGSTITGKYEIDDSWVAANLTATTPSLVSGSAPTINAITKTGSTCGNSGGTATLSAPVNCDWYLAPDFSTAVGSNVSSITTSTAGLYYAKYISSCNSTEIWMSETVNDNGPTVVRLKPSVLGCSTSGPVGLQLISAGTYNWLPFSSSTETLATGSHILLTNRTTSTQFTVSATLASCTTSETIDLHVESTNGDNNLFMRDFVGDSGIGAHTLTAVYDSPDIFLSATPNGTPVPNGPYTDDDTPAYMNVKVTNSTNNASSGILTVYWGKAGLAQTWIADWNNKTTPSTYTNAPQNNVPSGDRIGQPLPITVPANTTVTFSFPWVVPNPALFPGQTGDHFHFCVVATIETCCQILPNNSYLLPNVQQSSHFSWKNFDIMFQEYLREFGYGNTSWTFQNAILKGTLKRNSKNETCLAYGEMYMELLPEAYEKWKDGGSEGTGIEDAGDNKIRITGEDATIENIGFEVDERSEGQLSFVFTRQAALTDSFDVYLEQYYDGSDTLVGGIHYLILPPQCPTVAIVKDNDLSTECVFVLQIENPDTDVEYKWYDSDGNYVYTGETYTASVTVSTFFVAKACANGCEISADYFVEIAEGVCDEERPLLTLYNEVQQDLVPIFSVNPNPAQENLRVNYNLNESEKGSLVLTNTYGQVYFEEDLNANKHQVNIDCAQYPAGVYVVTVIKQGNIKKSMRVIVVK
jgi:hypothetical protein